MNRREFLSMIPAGVLLAAQPARLVAQSTNRGVMLMNRIGPSISEKGLRILDIASRTVRVLTTEYDNLPGWSPDGRRIVFTRQTSATNFDVFTIRPDGTGLDRLTTDGSNDGHAVWTYDGRIMWSSVVYGFRDEAALYDDTFQPYGQIFIMDADGSNQRIVTDSLWEDSMPLLIPAKFVR